jgi:hypothetical protein
MTNSLDWIYDLETYPNVFTAAFKHPATGTRMLFEISDRHNDIYTLIDFLTALKGTRCRMVGFNNIGFDYPIIHFIIENYHLNPTVSDIYNKAADIIATPWEHRFDNVIWDQDIHIPQIDLYKIHHFDNESRRTSLKMLEFNMRSDNIKDLPYAPGTPLTDPQKDVLIEYNNHDVDETEKFYFESIPMIEFREQLSEKYGRNFLNHNDTKIGKDYFIMKLEQEIPGSCYMYIDNKRTPRQTIRPSIRLADAILPYIQFKQPEFQRIKQWLSSQVITETKGIFNDLKATVNGFDFVFGLGGIHGSIESQTIYSDDDFVIIDADVASYYPNLAIANRLYPEHLSEQFCDIYKDVFEQRRQYAKGTPENAMLKLALNGVYGDSNSKYSPFYDPLYTMKITINGQLLLCLLAEYLIMYIPGLEMVQINTDGLTVKCPRGQLGRYYSLCYWWQDFTKLELEYAEYSRMFIRDVNNYIAEYESGKIKRKGAYEYNLEWHQNHSALVIPKAAEAALVHGQDIADFIYNHNDIHDFMLRTKVGRSDQLILDKTLELQRITRYYVAVNGDTLTKISPPTKGCQVGQWKRANGLTDAYYNSVLTDLKLIGDITDVLNLPWDERINTKNKSKYVERRTNYHVGWVVAPCNNINDADRNNINFDYYINQVKKLVEPLR